MNVRNAAVAGSFYPADATALRAEVMDYLGAATALERAPKAIVVPHAGYVYSGPIAAAAYAQLESVASVVRHVVLIGPSHRVPLRGIAVPAADRFATPLGEIEIDSRLRARVRALSCVVTSEPAHAFEHSLEVQLPFLQTVLDEFTLLPLAAGRASVHETAEVLDAVWGGLETLLVISTDLSHFHDYHTARVHDADTAARIVAMRSDLDGEDACGCVGLNGFLQLASRRELESVRLDVRNSGDTAGDRSRVVGYGAFAFYEQASG